MFSSCGAFSFTPTGRPCAWLWGGGCSALVQFLQLLDFALALAAEEGSHSCPSVPAAQCGCLMAGGVLPGWGEQKGSLLAPLLASPAPGIAMLCCLAAGRVNEIRMQP